MQAGDGLRWLERIIWGLSWFTVMALVPYCLLRGTLCPSFPPWVHEWAVPILTSAAVGYVTNWIAILLLFRPYEKGWWGFQGLVPRKKQDLARSLAQEIPARLLKPEELVKQIGTFVRDTLGDRDRLATIRALVSRYTRRYAEPISEIVISRMEGIIRDLVAKNMTHEQILKAYERLVLPWLSKRENRDRLAEGIVSALRNRVPEMTGPVRELLAKWAGDYARDRDSTVAAWLVEKLSLDEKLSSWVKDLDWDKIGEKISDELSKERTKERICEELTELTEQFQTYLRSPEVSGGLQAFLDSNIGKVENACREYMCETLPKTIDEWLSRDTLWLDIEKRFLPAIQSFVDRHLERGGKDKILGWLDLEGRIERSVNGLDVRELHEMVNRVSSDQLTYIQVLGYFLGGIAGVGLAWAM